MDSVLTMMRASVAIVVAMSVTAAPSIAGQATFISGYAANTALAQYRRLAAQQAVPAVATAAANVSLTVQEDIATISIAFHRIRASSGPEVHATAAGSRPVSSRAYFSTLEDGSKTLGPAQTSALLAALEFADRQPAPSETVRQDALAGHYIFEVFEPGGQYIFVSMSYPGSADLGKTSIGCNPRRSFRYDTTTGALTEIKPPCP